MALIENAIPTVVTVTTEAAKGLYPEHPLLACWVGRLTATTFDSFLQQWQVVGGLDASHPFATEVSKGAIAALQRQGLPYLRYERPKIDAQNDNWVSILPDLATLFRDNYLDQQRVLLVLGCRQLTAFAPWQDRAQLYARVLPSVDAIAAAHQAGFSSQRLAALRPPVSAELEAALWQQWRITTVIAKASGPAGGEAVKRQVAHRLKVRLLLIRRPPIDYPAITGHLEAAIKFCQQTMAARVLEGTV